MHSVAQIGKFECSSVVWGKGLDIVIRGILLFCVCAGKKIRDIGDRSREEATQGYSTLG